MRLSDWRIALTLVLLLHSTTASLAKGASDAGLLRGKQLFQQKKYALAVAAFTQALDKDSKLKQGFLLRGDCEQLLKKYQDAAGDYTQYSLLAPNDPAGYVRLSKAYSSQGKNNLALSYLGKAVLLSPKDASLYAARATIYDKLGKHALASDDRNVAAALRHAPTRTAASAFADLQAARGGSSSKRRANKSTTLSRADNEWAALQRLRAR